MDLMEAFRRRCTRDPRRIVLPEGHDPRIIEAARIVARKGLAKPILLSRTDEIVPLSSKLGIDLEGVEVVDPLDHPKLSCYIEEYLRMRSKKGITRPIAARIMAKSLHFACMMVRVGEADGVVAGAKHLTASVIKAGKLFIGLQEQFTEPSSFFIMDTPGHGQLIFADCAVNPDPDPDLLAQIALASGHSARNLLEIHPEVAMLSFSTMGSADSPHVSKVVQATEIVRKMDPGLSVLGEIQADAAIVPEIAASKGVPEGGRANVLVFPDLDAGNISYKLVQHLAGARAYGPFLQGFRKPINDLSRGCTVDEVVGTVMVTSIQAGSLR
jgi:phosphate acetyltransferase